MKRTSTVQTYNNAQTFHNHPCLHRAAEEAAAASHVLVIAMMKEWTNTKKHYMGFYLMSYVSSEISATLILQTELSVEQWSRKRSRSHWSASTDLYSCWKYSVSLFPWVDWIRASSPTVKALTPSSFTLKQTKQSTMAATTCSARSQQPTKQSTVAETTCLSWSQQANKMVHHGNDHLFIKESTSKQNSQLWQRPPVYHGVKQIKWSTTAVTTYQGVNKQTKQSTMAATTCLSWSQHANTTVNHSSYHLSWSQWTNNMVNRGSDHLFINQLMHERDWKPYAHFHIEPNSQFSLLSVQQKWTTNPF